MDIGLDYQVGVGGKRLSSVQRQKLGLARALLKEPDLLVVNEAVAVMDGATQGRLMESILRYRDGRAVIWTLQRASMAGRFQRLVVLRSGRVVEQGDYSELNKPGAAYTTMVEAVE
jgi:putative ABC transport system ATP-binding protein